MSDYLEDLVGKTIEEVRINSINTYIIFVTTEGSFVYFCDADCCSESWINHISGLQAIIGQQVIKTDKIDMDDLGEGDEGFSGRQEVDQIYCYKIFTDKGVCELEMRNASNGYYGGWLERFTFCNEQGPLRTITQDF